MSCLDNTELFVYYKSAQASSQRKPLAYFTVNAGDHQALEVLLLMVRYASLFYSILQSLSSAWFQRNVIMSEIIMV